MIETVFRRALPGRAERSGAAASIVFFAKQNEN
jgi:hypothetical protein